MKFVGEQEDREIEAIITAFYEAEGTWPPVAGVAIGFFDETVRVAVVHAEPDVTLLVADPTWRVVGGWWPSLGMEPSLGEFPKIIAAVGSDARPGHDPLRSQADSIHFIGLDGSGTASILGLPRDSWVEVPDRGRMKATSSLLRGGPDVMMATFANLTGLEFDGYVLTGFEGFTGLIDVLGGVDIDVPLDLNDQFSKADIDAGRQLLNSFNTLAFARTRKTISGGDFTRQEHGGLILIAAATMVQSTGIGIVPHLLEQSRDRYFTNLSAEDLLLTVAAILRSDLTDVPNMVAPGTLDRTSGGASIVRLSDEAYPMFEDLKDGRLGN